MDASRSQEFDWYYNRHEPVADRGKQVAAAPEQRRNEEDPRRVVRGPCRNGHAWGGRVAVGLVKVKHPGRGRIGLGAQDASRNIALREEPCVSWRCLVLCHSSLLPRLRVEPGPQVRTSVPVPFNLQTGVYPTRGWVFSPNLFSSSPGVSVSKSRWAT